MGFYIYIYLFDLDKLTSKRRRKNAVDKFSCVMVVSAVSADSLDPRNYSTKFPTRSPDGKTIQREFLLQMSTLLSRCLRLVQEERRSDTRKMFDMDPDKTSQLCVTRGGERYPFQQ